MSILPKRGGGPYSDQRQKPKFVKCFSTSSKLMNTESVVCGQKSLKEIQFQRLFGAAEICFQIEKLQMNFYSFSSFFICQMRDILYFSFLFLHLYFERCMSYFLLHFYGLNFIFLLVRRRYISNCEASEGVFASWVSREKERQYKFAQEAESRK